MASLYDELQKDYVGPEPLDSGAGNDSIFILSNHSLSLLRIFLV